MRADMVEILRPTTPEDVADAIADAVRAGTRLHLTGGGSKAGIGTPDDAARLSLAGFDRIVDYDPAELVLTVGAGTPLAEVQRLVASRNQMLAFEPFDHGPIFGAPPGAATIGGVVVAGVAGSQRLTQGGARDHLLGFEAVSGRGERFVAGAKVVKNVTGYDLPKLAAGSWGRLFAITELTLKVLPAPRVTTTWAIDGLSFATARTAMACALGSQADVAAAAFLPARAGEPSRTLLRLQGFESSVAVRGAMLCDLMRDTGRPYELPRPVADEAWDDLRTLRPLPSDRPLWRINVPASHGPSVIEALPDADWLGDWAGGLLWIATDLPATSVRAAAEHAGGHALLVRASPDLRARTAAFHPPATGVAMLEQRIRRAFDPAGVFETGRFGEAQS